MTTRFRFFTISLLSSLLMASLHSYGADPSDVCNTQHAQKIKDNYKAKKEQAESEIDTSNDIDNNPWIYKNPDQCIDLGISLEFPGLPTFGDPGDFNACKALKSITGKIAGEINDQIQDEIDTTMEEITASVEDSLSDTVGTDIELEESDNTSSASGSLGTYGADGSFKSGYAKPDSTKGATNAKQ